MMLKRLGFIVKLEWKYARLAFLWDVAEKILSTLSSLAIPYIMKLAVDTVVTQNLSLLPRLIFLIALTLGVNLISAVVYSATVYYRQDYIFTRDVKFKNDLYRKAVKVSPECFERSETYDTYARATEIELDDIHSAFSSLGSIVFQIVSIVAIAGIMISYNPVIALVYLLAYIPLLWVKLHIQKKLHRFKVDTTAENRKKDAMFEFIHDKKAVAELKVFHAFNFVIETRNEIADKLKSDTIRLKAENELKLSAVDVIPNLVYYGAYIVYAMAAIAGTITYGDLTFLVTAMGKYSTSLSTIGIWITSQQDNFFMMDKIMAFMDLPPEREAEREDCSPLPAGFECLSLKDVSFTYPGNEEETLKHLDVTIRRGEKTAIVGQNGSGKTTTVKLMLGLFDSYNGRYEINNTDARTVSHGDVYRMFSPVMQDYVKYPFSVRENIEISDCSKHDAQLCETASQRAGADEFVRQLEKGYETNLNKQYDPEGTDLSEGQWHKIALARALYQDHEVVVFDEPTSSLDPISEYEFVQDVKTCMADKTVLFITHRLSSVVDFDRILVFENGRIIGDGCHRDLMESCEVYRNMFEVQASRYKSE